MVQRNIIPATVHYSIGVRHESSVQCEDHPKCVVGDLIHAVVGNVGDYNPKLGRLSDINIVDADAVASGDFAVCCRFKNLGGYLSEAKHDRIDIFGEFGQCRFRCVGSDN